VIKQTKGFVHLFLVIAVVVMGFSGLLYFSWQRELIKTNFDQDFSPTSAPAENSTSNSASSKKTDENCITPKPRFIPSKPEHTTIDPNQPRDRIYVQFTEGTAIRLREGRLVSLTNVNLNQLNNILNQFEVQIEQLYPKSEEELDAERLAGEALNCKELADKNLAYLLKLQLEQDAEKLIDKLNGLPIVELAEPVPVITNP
jgi:hypothetical protein